MPFVFSHAALLLKVLLAKKKTDKLFEFYLIRRMRR